MQLTVKSIEFSYWNCRARYYYEDRLVSVFSRKHNKLHMQNKYIYIIYIIKCFLSNENINRT